MSDLSNADKQDLIGSTQPRRLNPVVLLIVVGFALALVFGLGLALLKGNLSQLESGAAPDFTIKTYEGGAFSLSQQRGKVVLINFWASWCGPCRSEAPALNAIFDEYKAKGVVLIGVGHLDNESDARAFMKEFGMIYTTGADNGTEVYDNYRAKGVPETYVVDKNGSIAKTYIGPINEAELRTLLDQLTTAAG